MSLGDAISFSPAIHSSDDVASDFATATTLPSRRSEQDDHRVGEVGGEDVGVDEGQVGRARELEQRPGNLPASVRNGLTRCGPIGNAGSRRSQGGGCDQTATPGMRSALEIELRTQPVLTRRRCVVQRRIVLDAGDVVLVAGIGDPELG